MLLSKLKMVAAVLVLLAVILGIGVGVLQTPAQVAGDVPGGPVPPALKCEAKVKWEYKAGLADKIEKLAPEGSKDKLTDGLL